MSNPWEDFSSNEGGNPWDDFTPEQPKKKRGLPEGTTAKQFLPTEQETEDYLAKLRGLAETGRGLIGGVVGGVGGLAGTLAGALEYGMGRESAQKREAAAAKGMETFSAPFQPTTPAGEQYMGNVGTAINEVANPLLGHMPQIEGFLTASGAARAMKNAAKPPVVPKGTKMAPEVPLTLDEALAQAEKAPENQRVGPSAKTTLPWEDFAPEAPAAGGKNLRQMELDFTEHPEVVAISGRGEAVPTTQASAQIRPPEVALEAQRRAEAEANRVPLEGQGDLFMNEEVGPGTERPIATPLNAAERGALPEEMTANPALARRQMEMQLSNEEPIHVTGAGEATRGLPEQVRTITEDAAQVEYARAQAEAKARELQAKQAVENGQTGNLFADYVNQHRDYELFRDENGQPLSRSAFNETVDNLAKEPSTGYIRPEDMDAAYRKYLENFGGVQAGLFDQPTTALEMAATLRQDAAIRMRDNHPIVKAAERFANEQQQFLDQLKQQGATAEAIADAAKDVAAATKRLEKTRENVSKSLKEGSRARALPKNLNMYEGIGETVRRTGYLAGRNKQRGGTTTDFLTGVLTAGLDRAFSKKGLEGKRVEITPGENRNKFLPQQVKQGLADYTKERRSAEEIKNDIITKNIPDIKNTPVSDKVQAGGLYKQLETNNPIVRKTFAAVSDADHRAKANIRILIQDPKNGLPALFRKLTKSEAGDWWAVRQMVEGEADLTPAQMKAAGMNDKQITMNEAFKNATDFVFNKINEARELAGKAPIDKRVGYMAGQASGDFRRLVYKRGADGNKEVIGVIGSDIRAVLDRRVAKLLEANPEWEVGNEQVGGRGRRESRQKAFEDAVEMLAENNPATKELMDTYDAILRKDAYDYMNAKKHTMQKKGVFGTEGFKRDVDAWTNAKEGMASQIRYLEKMMNWAEMSKAVDEVKPLLTDDSINMPNAKRWSSDYIDRALGIQTSEVGAAIDGLIGAVGKGMGVGPSAMERGVGRTKSVVSKYLLGFANPVFLAINMVQPAVATPAINALLTSRGIKLRPGTLTRGAMDYAHIQLAERFPDRFKLDSFQKDLLKEGHERNIFGSEIFEHVPHLRKSGQVASNIAEWGISSVEGATRGSTFTAYAKALKENGYKGKELFDIAENLTNQVMTDYRNIEAPSMYKELGALGDISVTLQRYKHNSLSNLAMLAREAKNNKNYKPIAVAMGAMLATSGLTGMLGFNEADFLYQQYTKHFTDKPDTLTRVLLDNAPDTLSYGAISTLTNMDMSKRFGMALAPDSVSGALFPGASRLAEPVMSGAKALLNPTDKTQWQRFARDVVPNSMRGLVERKFFENDEGKAINPNTLEATVQRTPTDQRAKNIGSTGLHESKEKARLYQEQLVDKAFTAKRQGITNKVLDDLYNMKSTDEMREYFHNGKGKQLIQDYTDAEGDVGNLVKAVEKFRLAGKTTAMQRKQLAIETASPKQAKRYADMTRNQE